MKLYVVEFIVLTPLLKKVIILGKTKRHATAHKFYPSQPRLIKVDKIIRGSAVAEGPAPRTRRRWGCCGRRRPAPSCRRAKLRRAPTAENTRAVVACSDLEVASFQALASRSGWCRGGTLRGFRGFKDASGSIKGMLHLQKSWQPRC